MKLFAWRRFMNFHCFVSFLKPGCFVVNDVLTNSFKCSTESTERCFDFMNFSDEYSDSHTYVVPKIYINLFAHNTFSLYFVSGTSLQKSRTDLHKLRTLFSPSLSLISRSSISTAALLVTTGGKIRQPFSITFKRKGLSEKTKDCLRDFRSLNLLLNSPSCSSNFQCLLISSALLSIFSWTDFNDGKWWNVFCVESHWKSFSLVSKLSTVCARSEMSLFWLCNETFNDAKWCTTLVKNAISLSHPVFQTVERFCLFLLGNLWLAVVAGKISPLYCLQIAT